MADFIVEVVETTMSLALALVSSAQAQERRTPGIKFLVEVLPRYLSPVSKPSKQNPWKVLEHDYPDLEVRQEAWPFRIPHKTSRMAV